VPVCPKPLSVLLFEGIVSALFALGFLYLTIRLFTENSVGSVLSTSSFSFGPFLLVVSIVATWQITYGPYVADYSRYLPHDTPISSSFWWTYTGSVLSSIWMMAFGSIAVAVVGAEFANNSVRYVWNRQDSDSAS
jgi:NCS1 family nucleobase:cation symporter-1